MTKSKIAEIKEKVKWQKFGPQCKNCKHYHFDIVEEKNQYGTYKKEKHRRCDFGFATGMSCWCSFHEFK